MSDPGPRRPPRQGSAGEAPGLYQLLQIGATCGVTIGIGMFAGYLLDRVAGTGPLLVFVGLALGILAAATGSYYVIRPFVSPPTPGSDTGSTPKD